MAANTSFADFPRLSAITAADGLLPRQFNYRGSRLVFSRGIVVLALLASAVDHRLPGQRDPPDPAVCHWGVHFLYPFSDRHGAALVEDWPSKGRPGDQRTRINPALPAGLESKDGDQWDGRPWLTLLVMIIFAVTKFTDGAWVVHHHHPILVMLFSVIHSHYQRLARNFPWTATAAPPPRIQRNRVLLPIGGVHRGTLAALRYARTLSDDITAVHISIEPGGIGTRAPKMGTMGRWGAPGDRRIRPTGVLWNPCWIISMKFIRNASRMRSSRLSCPSLSPKSAGRNVLHTNTAAALREALMFYKRGRVTNVPLSCGLGRRSK